MNVFSSQKRGIFTITFGVISVPLFAYVFERIIFQITWLILYKLCLFALNNHLKIMLYTPSIIEYKFRKMYHNSKCLKLKIWIAVYFAIFKIPNLNLVVFCFGKIYINIYQHYKSAFCLVGLWRFYSLSMGLLCNPYDKKNIISAIIAVLYFDFKTSPWFGRHFKSSFRIKSLDIIRYTEALGR